MEQALASGGATPFRDWTFPHVFFWPACAVGFFKQEKAMKAHPTLVKSFGYATKGLWTAVKTERNIRIQLAAAALAVALGFALRLVAWEWAAVLGCCGAVLGAELTNTAIETVVDLVSPGYDERAGRAKDIAAAVWTVAIFAALVGAVVFAHAAWRLAA